MWSKSRWTTIVYVHSLLHIYQIARYLSMCHSIHVPALQEDFTGVRDWLYWFATTFGPKVEFNNIHGEKEFGVKNDLAMDITFGSSIGYSLALARPFKRVCWI